MKYFFKQLLKLPTIPFVLLYCFYMRRWYRIKNATIKYFTEPEIQYKDTMFSPQEHYNCRNEIVGIALEDVHKGDAIRYSTGGLMKASNTLEVINEMIGRDTDQVMTPKRLVIDPKQEHRLGREVKWVTEKPKRKYTKRKKRKAKK